MTDAFSRFDGGVPENYDTGLGPIIFSDFAADIARRVAESAPDRVLEIAAGTGIVSRKIRDELRDEAPLTVSDLNPPMLAIARQKFSESENVSFELADATDLQFEDTAFDTVACQFGVMFFPDKGLAYREAHRVLGSGGRYIFSVWGSFEDNPFARIAHETIAQFFSGEPPGFYKLPFGYYETDPIMQSLYAAGFEGADATVVEFEKEIPDMDAFSRGLVFGNPVIEEIRSRSSVDPQAVALALTDELNKAFGTNPGRIGLRAIVVSARKA